MWDLDLTNMNSSNCYDSMISILLKRFGFEEALLYLNSFSSKHFTVDKDGIGHIIRGIYSSDILNNLFHMSTEAFDLSSITDLEELISKELAFCPVGVWCDPYDCHWSPLFGKQHYSHLLLIIDIDNNNKSYVCVDVYYQSTGNIILSFDAMKSLCKEIFVFKFPGEICDYTMEAWDYLKNYIKVPDKSEYKEENENMIEYILSLSPDTIGNPANIETSILLINLMWISEDKRNFLKALQYLDNRAGKPFFESVYPLLEEASKEVALLKNILMKYAITHNQNADKIKRSINEFYRLNREIAEEMHIILLKR